MNITITDDDTNQSEVLEVSTIDRYCHDLEEPIEEGWHITGLKHYYTEHLGSELK